jgi:hypothetical protein
MDKADNSADSTAKLREAIDKLKAYSSLDQIETVEKSSISKTIALVRSILEKHFDSQPKKLKRNSFKPDQQQILEAIELINSKRFFIKKLKEGTPAEQELAEEFTKTIDTYNKSCDKQNQVCTTARQRLANFFSKDKTNEKKLPKIALPKKITVQHHYPENFASKTIEKIRTTSDSTIQLTKQSAELFQMKVIALLERYGIASNPEARNFVKTSPIHAAIQNDATTCTLTQTLSLFPGQTIVVKGNSSLDPKTQTINRLFPDTFHLSLELTQTGFPHPIQRTGWSLASQLIPDSPQRIDLLNKTASLFYKRNEVITSLLQQGPMLKHAKMLHALKRNIFEKYAPELIKLHKTLSLAFLKAASAAQSTYEEAEKFFNNLAFHSSPMQVLSEIYHILRENFIVKPHQQLLNAIIKGKSTNLGNDNPKVRYHVAKDLLNDALKQAKFELHIPNHTNLHLKFINIFGNIYAKASKNIILQYLSEDLIFLPPTLSSFECKLQAAAYLHLSDFLDELLDSQTYTPEYLYQLIKKQIFSDIHLFQEESPPEISKELSLYFQARFNSLSNI